MSGRNGYSANRASYNSSNSRFNPMGNGNKGKSGNACFKCGEEGHWSRECPLAGGGGSNGYSSNRGGSGGGGACFKCGEEGHWSRECPNAGGQNSNFYGAPSQLNKEWGDFAGANMEAINWSSVKLNDFKKDFYKESAKTAALDQKKIDQWKKKHNLECMKGYQDKMTMPGTKGKKGNADSYNVPKPVLTFEDLGNAFPKNVMNGIRQAGFESPTPIQSATWPIVLSGKNVIGVARTGSGKTLAFLLPAIVHINAQPRMKPGDGPIAVIIAPTRELACQIEGEVEKFAKGTRHACVYGGAKRGYQVRQLRMGVQIVIATPGRLLDFLESKVTNFRRVTYCVIDEADRLLDMGFEPQLNAIMGQIRPDRQMMMYSATWPKEVRALAKKYLVRQGGISNVYQVAIGSLDSLHANENVTQEIRFLSSGEKALELKNIIDEYLGKNEDNKILIFIATKKMCNKLSDMLWSEGYYVTCIHGDLNQSQRERALGQFKSGQMKILCATDVAARGLHVNDITVVVNYDCPRQIEDYVHRIGRTGRAGKKGTAISFFDEDQDAKLAQPLVQVLRDAKQTIPDELHSMRGGGGRSRGRFGGGGRGRGRGRFGGGGFRKRY